MTTQCETAASDTMPNTSGANLRIIVHSSSKWTGHGARVTDAGPWRRQPVRSLCRPTPDGRSPRIADLESLLNNVPDFSLCEQADHTPPLLWALVRRLRYVTEALRRGDWSARHHPGVHRLAGQTLGLIGFGASALAVAERAAAFDRRLIAWARNAADVLLGRWPKHVVNPEVRPRSELRPPADDL
jgi:hypothetical protein